MVDPKKVDFNQLPKKFCDGAIGAMSNDSFFIGMTSGNNIDSFALPPRTMKSIAAFFQKHVENYESMYGVIDMTPPLIPSPIQTSDLDNN
jgi:hypothetical protein